MTRAGAILVVVIMQSCLPEGGADASLDVFLFVVGCIDSRITGWLAAFFILLPPM